MHSDNYSIITIVIIRIRMRMVIVIIKIRMAIEIREINIILAIMRIKMIIGCNEEKLIARILVFVDNNLYKLVEHSFDIFNKFGRILYFVL